MATKVYGRKRKSSGGPGKRLGKRKVWRETPTGSSGRARCACHHSWPCPRKTDQDQ